MELERGDRDGVLAGARRDEKRLHHGGNPLFCLILDLRPPALCVSA